MIDTESEKLTKETKQKEDLKKARLLQAFENNLKISSLGLHDKFDSFEAWECTKSKRLLYEIGLAKDKKYARYPRGSIIKVDFGVNVGGEFSEQHFAITLTKKDGIYSNSIIVIPLTSKKHKNTIDLGKLISNSYIQSLQNEIDILQKNIKEIDIDNCEFNPNFKRQINQIEDILKYYKTIKDNFSYARIDQIRTVSKLNILPKINEYDIVGNFKCSKNLMDEIDKNIVRVYTGIDYREFEKFIDNK